MSLFSSLSLKWGGGALSSTGSFLWLQLKKDPVTFHMSCWWILFSWTLSFLILIDSIQAAPLSVVLNLILWLEGDLIKMVSDTDTTHGYVFTRVSVIFWFWFKLWCNIANHCKCLHRGLFWLGWQSFNAVLIWISLVSQQQRWSNREFKRLLL